MVNCLFIDVYDMVMVGVDFCLRVSIDGGVIFLIIVIDWIMLVDNLFIMVLFFVVFGNVW